MNGVRGSIAIAGGKPAERSGARAQLLAATSELMIERDTIEVSLHDIAMRAGLNAGLVRYYFGGKEGLLIALAKRDSEFVLGQLDTLMTSDMSPGAKLARHIGAAIDTFFRFPYLNRLLGALLRDANSDSARAISESLTRPLLAAEKEMLDAGVASGELRRVDPMLFYFAAMGLAGNLFAGRAELRWVFGVDGIDDTLRRRHGEFIVDLLMRGMAPDRGGSTETKSARGRKPGSPAGARK